METTTAEVHAIKILGWLVGNDELLAIFQGASGACVEDFKERAGDSEFLVAVLDFICLDDAWVIEAAGAVGINPEDVFALRESLPGGERMHWT